MAEVKVLVEGVHNLMDGKMRIGSTVTLIKSDKNIIVDTESFLDKEKIIEALEKENLTPDKIDIVVLTHLHLDHIVNTYLFTNAKVFCKFRGEPYPGQFHTPKEGCLQRTDIIDGIEIADGVELLLTPGHTNDMISIIVDTDKGKVVIAGDAIPKEEWTNLNKQPNPNLVDVEKFNASRKKILEIADYIVPGHGNMFRVEK